MNGAMSYPKSMVQVHPSLRERNQCYEPEEKFDADGDLLSKSTSQRPKVRYANQRHMVEEQQSPKEGFSDLLPKSTLRSSKNLFAGQRFNFQDKFRIKNLIRIGPFARQE
jgi:hypothetical protein